MESNLAAASKTSNQAVAFKTTDMNCLSKRRRGTGSLRRPTFSKLT